MTAPRVLLPGELYEKERFDAATVNQGAVLLECTWDGGDFRDGAMLGGAFRSGTFRGGVFWGGIWLSGSWHGGTWEHGFGPDGSYRPRSVHP